MDRTQVRMGSLLLGVAVQVACAWPDPTGQWQQPTDDTVDEVVDDVPPVVDPPTPACPGAQGIAYEQPRPNEMLLVDRSGSMSSPGSCDTGACPSKWNQLLALGSRRKTRRCARRPVCGCRWRSRGTSPTTPGRGRIRRGTGFVVGA
jgi:hypothetical protein